MIRERIASHSMDVALLLSFGPLANTATNVLAQRLTSVGFNASLAFTNNAPACDLIEVACAFSSMHITGEVISFGRASRMTIRRFIRQGLRARVYWTYRLYAAGMNVFVLDTDVIVARNPFNYFSLHPEFSIIGALDGLPFNSGVLYTRHVDPCKDFLTQSLLEEYARRLIEWGDSFEQSVCIDVVTSMISGVPYATENEALREGRDKQAEGKKRVHSERTARIPFVSSMADRRRVLGEVVWEFHPLPVSQRWNFSVVDTFQRVPNSSPCTEPPVASILGVNTEFSYDVNLLCSSRLLSVRGDRQVERGGAPAQQPSSCSSRGCHLRVGAGGAGQPGWLPTLVHLSGGGPKAGRPDTIAAYYNGSLCGQISGARALRAGAGRAASSTR